MNCVIISDITEIENENETRSRLLERILEEYRLGASEFYTNCMRGVSLMAAEIICGLKSKYDIKLHIVVPSEKYAADWSNELRERYERCCERADSMTVLFSEYKPDGLKLTDSFMKEKCGRRLIFWG